jgi:hypothetical protein
MLYSSDGLKLTFSKKNANQGDCWRHRHQSLEAQKLLSDFRIRERPGPMPGMVMAMGRQAWGPIPAYTPRA